MNIAADRTSVHRAFGSDRRHLDIRFQGGSRPELVTQVLAACLDRADKEAIWNWSVARRLQALLAVALAGGEQRAVHLARCANADCGQEMELDLDLGDFVLAADDTLFDWSPDNATRLEIRLPTGNDQRSWAEQQESAMLPAAALATELVQRVDGQECPPAWRMPAQWVESLATELERRDPLTALELSAQCPTCSTETQLEFDLEAFLLQRLARRQSALMEQVHRLAAVYHWPESEILAIPAWRREFYLNRIDSGAWL